VTAQSLYGTLTFQGTSLIAVVEDLPDDTYRLIVDVNQNGDLTDDQLYQANSGYEAVQGLEFLVHYPSSNTDRTYSISLYHWIPFQTLQYYRTHLCAGTLPLEAMDRQIVVLDDDADSVFGEPSVDWVVLDIDGNGVADGVSGGGEQFKQGAAFYVGGNPYSVSSVPPEGDSITVASAALGTWEGDITNESTGQPVLGASVKIFAPGLATTVPADQSGHYQVQLGAGAYQKVFVSAPGFVPEALYWTAPSVAGWGNTTLPYSLKPVPPPVATVSLVDGDSFNFLGVEAGRYTGGDFYATVQDPDFRFYANNMGQQGLQDLGDLGPVPLDTVSIPESGYYRYGVTAVAGHTYVSLALEAEDGHYIVFRVTEVVPGDHVALTYLFTPPWPDAVLPTPTPTPTPIPGLSPPALVLMAALLVAASIWTSRRRLRRERVNSA
jgi:hypothetical protein